MLKKLNQIQAKAKKAALKALKTEGKALLHMATGTGKTETAIKIFSEYEKQNKRMLWITHKTDLVNQSAGRIKTKLKTEDVTVFFGEEKDLSGKIVVASVQSLSKISNLEKFDSQGFDLICIDEAHHAPAESWNKVINYFTGHKLALTATPYRPDKRDITELFGQPIFIKRFSDAQKEGILAQHKARLILTNSTIEGFTNANKEYTKKQLEKLWVSKDRNKIIVNSYLEFGRKEVIKAEMKPKAICFCINIKHAQRMSKLFNRAGISSAFVSSNIKFQSAQQRSEVFGKFRTTHDIEVLCAVDILNEGTDIPDANIGIMARPTRSNIVYTQQAGRLGRADKGNKKFFVLLDFVENTKRIYLPYNAGTLVQKAYESNEIITKYVETPDPVTINNRVNDIMKSVESFEDQIRLDNLKTIEDRRKELEHVIKFGEYSNKVRIKNVKN